MSYYKFHFGKTLLMTTKIFLFICITALIASCSSTGKLAADSMEKRLVFGNGGGFTGIYTAYELRGDGQVYALLPDNSQRLVKRIKKKQTHAIFIEAEKLRTTQPDFNHPGNLTWFIKLFSGNEQTEFKWGDSNVSVPAEITELYNRLYTIVKK